jgi:hypothetical protein
MRLAYAAAILLSLITINNPVGAGDDASGPIRYATDLSQPFTTYVLSQTDKEWSKSLVARLKYSGPVVHFVRTSLPLKVDGKIIEGAIYQSLENPDYFYVVRGDAMLQLGTRWAYNPGVGGFSAHAPQSRNFIVCLNITGGVPFLSSSPVQRGPVSWNGHDWNRFSGHCCS